MGGRTWLLWAAVLLGACIAGGETDGAEGAGSSVARGSTSMASLSVCGASCLADLSAGREALSRGDFAAAHDVYKCADTPEAAFGAGLSQVMLALESDGADRLLADFGLPPFDAGDLLGPDGLVNRLGRRWNGEGALRLSGDLQLEASLRVQQERYTDEGAPVFVGRDGSPGAPSSYVDVELKAVGSKDGGRVVFDFYRSGLEDELEAGAQAFTSQFDCQTGTRVAGAAPNVELRVTIGGRDHDCYPASRQEPARCDPDGGSMRVAASGLAAGERVSLELDNLLLGCEVRDDDSGGGGAVLLPDGSVSQTPAPELLVRASGTMEATTVGSRLDTSGLHPILNDDVSWQVPSDRTVTGALLNLEATTNELARASCYFDAAAAGSGTVFTVPGALHGGPDADLSAGDAKVLSAATALVVAAGKLASVYGVDMPLGALVCEDSSGGCSSDGECMEQASGCAEESELVMLFNRSFAQMINGDRIDDAEASLRTGLERLSVAVDALDEHSALTRNSTTEPGLRQIQEIADAALRSLADGARGIPHILPEVTMDLRAFFASPPTRAGVPGDPLRYALTCDPEYPDDCWEDTQLNREFWDAFMADVLMLDWDAEFQWQDDDMLSDALKHSMYGVERSGLLVLE